MGREKKKRGKWGRKEEAKEKDNERVNLGEKKFFEMQIFLKGQQAEKRF